MLRRTVPSIVNGLGPVTGVTTPIVKIEFWRNLVFNPEVMLTMLGVLLLSSGLYPPMWLIGVLT